jgi:hypothetical protein
MSGGRMDLEIRLREALVRKLIKPMEDDDRVGWRNR